MNSELSATQPSIVQNESVFEHKRFTLFFETEAAWEAMFQAIDDAQKTIQYELYIFENDSCGQKFIEKIIEKAQQGIKVFLMCDRFGSASLYHSDYPKKLKAAGGSIHFYNDVFFQHIVKPMRIFPRTHVKMLVVDHNQAFIGGVCLSERMQSWRDTHIKVHGEIAQMMGKLLSSIEDYVKRRKIYRFRNLPKRIYGENQAMILLSSPGMFKFTIYKSFFRNIRQARKSIHITSAYFVPNRRFIRLLKHKAKEGVEINILVPANSDVRLADWVFLSHAHALLKSGIRIFAYNSCIMHAKTMVIDNHWSTVGSANFDLLSFFFNREANLVVEDQQLAEALTQQFQRDLNQSTEITLEILVKRPIHIKLIGYMSRLFKIFLIKSKA